MGIKEYVALDTPVEIEFRPEPEGGMWLACLWRYSEPAGDEPGFYAFAAITRDPPVEVVDPERSDRCVLRARTGSSGLMQCASSCIVVSAQSSGASS